MLKSVAGTILAIGLSHVSSDHTTRVLGPSTQGVVRYRVAGIIRAPTDSQDPNVMPDGRVSFLEIAKQEGFDQATIDRVRTDFGGMDCVDGDPSHNVQASATVVKSDDIILTAKHIVDDVYRLQRQASSVLSHCNFVNLADDKTYQQSRVSPEILAEGDTNNDWVLLKLQHPIFGTKPLPIGHSSESGLALPTSVNSVHPARLFNISFLQKGMINQVGNAVPTAQVCFGFWKYPPPGQSESEVREDCDNGFGGSGGLFLEKVGLTLVVVGMVLGNYGSHIDGQPYSPTENYGYGIGLDGGLLAAIEAAQP